MAGIYIHIPFCKRKCVYCDFYSTAQFEKYSSSYIDTVIGELETSRDFLSGDPVYTLYFGGGTPSLYSPDEIGRLIDTVNTIYGKGNLSEVTLEANPEDITENYLAGLKAVGVDRLSIGIQSFDDGLLAFMRRRHNGTKAEEAVCLAREAGFTNISIDLIYGIPGLTLGIWEHTLDKAVSLRPEHISAYHLTFEPGTTLGKWNASGKVKEVDQDESQAHFNILRNKLTEAGYDHYEVSNFALPGYRSRHNSSYWTGEKYLGIGPGAHSFNGSERRWCRMSIADYVVADKPLYGSETLTDEDTYNELIMTSLRCAGGITAKRIVERTGEKYASYFLSHAEELCRRGLLRTDGNRYYIDPKDFLVSDNIISSLFI